MFIQVFNCFFFCTCEYIGGILLLCKLWNCGAIKRAHLLPAFSRYCYPHSLSTGFSLSLTWVSVICRLKLRLTSIYTLERGFILARNTRILSITYFVKCQWSNFQKQIIFDIFLLLMLYYFLFRIRNSSNWTTRYNPLSCGHFLLFF